MDFARNRSSSPRGGRAIEAAAFAAAAVTITVSGVVPLVRAAHTAAEASALQTAVFSARLVAYAAEREDLREVALLRRFVAETARGRTREIAVVAEAWDDRFTVLSQRRYLAHSNPSKGAAPLDHSDPADRSAGESSVAVIDAFKAGRTTLRLPGDAKTVRVGAPVIAKGRPAATVLTTVEVAPVTEFVPAAPFAAAPVAAVALFLCFLFFAPRFRHAAAAVSLVLLAGLVLTGRDALPDIHLSLLADRAYFLSAGHNRLVSAKGVAPPAADFLGRMQEADSRPFLSMVRNETPHAGPGPLAQLKKSGEFSVAVPGFRASYSFAIDGSSISSLASGGRASYLNWTAGGTGVAAVVYALGALLAVALSRSGRGKVAS